MPEEIDFDQSDRSEARARYILGRATQSVGEGRDRRTFLNERWMNDLYLEALDVDYDGYGNPDFGFRSGGQRIVIRGAMDLNAPEVREEVYRRILHYYKIHEMLDENGQTVANFRDADIAAEDFSRKRPFRNVKKDVEALEILGGRKFPEMRSGVFGPVAVCLNFEPPRATGSSTEVRREDRDEKVMGIDFSYHDTVMRGDRLQEALLGEIVHLLYDGRSPYQNRRFTVGQWVPGIIDSEEVPEYMSFDEICYAMIGSAKCLQELWRKGIIHRDIKPDNIMMSRGDDGVTAVLGDMGMAKHAKHEDSKSITATGTILGTISYMSPEQLRGDKLEFASDMFSLGLTFYKFFSGFAEPAKVESSGEARSMLIKRHDNLKEGQFLYPLAAIDNGLGTQRQKEYMDEILSGMLQFLEMDRYHSLPPLVRDIRSVVSNGWFDRPRDIRSHAKKMGKSTYSYCGKTFKYDEPESSFLRKAGYVGAGLAALGGAGTALYFTVEPVRDFIDGLVAQAQSLF